MSVGLFVKLKRRRTVSSRVVLAAVIVVVALSSPPLSSTHASEMYFIAEYNRLRRGDTSLLFTGEIISTSREIMLVMEA